MSPGRIIPMEAVGDIPEEPVAFTDVVIAIYLEGVPSEEDDAQSPMFESGPLAESVIGAFALGCAVGIDFPDRVIPILEQTHPGAATQIIDECREPLANQVAAARASSGPLEPESFIGDLIDGLDEAAFADAQTAQNALSMSFEYGCLLAHTERPAAIVVRNAYNRDQAESVAEVEADPSADTPEGPDPYQSLQQLAAEVMSAYEADIGFGGG